MMLAEPERRIYVGAIFFVQAMDFLPWKTFIALCIRPPARLLESWPKARLLNHQFMTGIARLV